MSQIYLSRISCTSRKKIFAAGIILFFLSTACQVFAADILFISGTRFYDSDAAIRNGLESRGFEVTVIQDRQA